MFKLGAKSCTLSQHSLRIVPSTSSRNLARNMNTQLEPSASRDVSVDAAKGKGSPGGKKGSPKTSLLSGLLKKKAIAEEVHEPDEQLDDRARPEQ